VRSLAQPPVVQALERLSDADRELLLLVAWDGLSTEEAAAVLDCSRTALKVRLHRARRRLQAQLQLLDRREAAPLTATARLEGCHED
jgi:RNA polymerase sigma-70 factor (ECF subfamily)